MTVVYFHFFVLTMLLIKGTNDVFGFQNAVFKNVRVLRRLDGKGLASPNDDEILGLETQVKASTQARLDLKRVSEALELEPSNKNEYTSSTIASRWQIALSSAVVASVTIFIVLQSNIIAGAAFIGVFFVANQDPMEEEGAAGASARLLGRFAMNSVEVAKPRLKAVARAAITNEEEIYALRHEISYLRDENERLRIWKERRMAVDERSSEYTLDELKAIARENAIPVGGTKRVLMMRLLEAQAIEL
jgi:hypothetical protein